MFLRGAVLLGLLFGVAYCAYGEPVYQTTDGEVRVVLHDEPCTLKEVVNLPRRAVWHEKGKATEGCWAVRPDFGVIVMLFSDRTVGLAPIGDFRKVTAI